MINEQNIEERIFEYHEGLLNSGQKAELMAFLHEFPEWQRDFTLWAQAKLHDEKVNVEKLQQKITKNITTPYWTWARMTSVSGLEVLLLSLVIYSLSSSQIKTPIQGTNQIIQPSETKILLNQTTNKNQLNATKPNQKTKEFSSKVIQKFNNKSEENRGINQDTATSYQTTIIASDSLISPLLDGQTMDTNISLINEKDKDTIHTVTDIKAKDKMSGKKKKNRPKISLIPTSDIVPSNPNF